MLKLIKEFQKSREGARAYFCYLFERNIPNRLPDINFDVVEESLHKVLREVKEIDGAYVLDAKGVQISDNVSMKTKYRVGKDQNRSGRSYYQRAVKQKKCVLTDPYPSIMTGDLCVSASKPIYNEKGELLYVVVIDISLEALVNVVHIQKGDIYFNKFTKAVYTIFAVALFLVAAVLFYHGVKSFFIHGIDGLKVKQMFESTILLTLSLAIFDLLKTIYQEEVTGTAHDDTTSAHIHKTMIKFLGSIIIAIAIEALMLVFKFALTTPDNLVYAAYLLAGVTALIFGLAYYLKSVHLCNLEGNR